MPDQRTELEIRIRTIAEEQGVKLTEQGLQRIKERTQELGSRTTAATGEFRGFTAAQKEQAQQALRNIEANEKTARSAGSLAKDVNSAKSAFGGLRDIISGGLNGNLLQVGAGFAKISAATTGATPAVQALFGAIARGAAASLVVAGPVLVLIQAMKLAASDAEAQMKRWWDEAAKGAEAYKQKSAEVKAAAEADLKVMLASVQKVAEAYSDLVGRMDEAEKRAKAVAAAKKELELASANTPEEKAAIEARYGKDALVNESLNADLRERNAQEAQTQARQKVRDAEAGVRDAEAEAQAAADNVRTFGTNTNADSLEAVANWRAAKDKVAAAKENLSKVQDSSSEIFKRTDQEINDARLTREVSGIRHKTLSVTTAKETASSLGSSSDRRAELTRAANNAQASGDYAGQDRAVAELRKLDAAASKLSKAIISTGATTTTALDAATKELQKQKQRTANTAESRAGS